MCLRVRDGLIRLDGLWSTIRRFFIWKNDRDDRGRGFEFYRLEARRTSPAVSCIVRGGQADSRVNAQRPASIESTVIARQSHPFYHRLRDLAEPSRFSGSSGGDRRAGLAKTVPFDASQPANGTSARVANPRGLLLARELGTGGTAELFACDRG